MSNIALYGLLLLVALVLVLGAGIALVNWMIDKAKGVSGQRR